VREWVLICKSEGGIREKFARTKGVDCETIKVKKGVFRIPSRHEDLTTRNCYQGEIRIQGFTFTLVKKGMHGNLHL